MPPNNRAKLHINQSPDTLARKSPSSLTIQLQHYFIQYQLKYLMRLMQFELKSKYFKLILFSFRVLQETMQERAWALVLMTKSLTSAKIHPMQHSSSYTVTTKPNQTTIYAQEIILLFFPSPRLFNSQISNT